jgi:hypothetical protein
MTVYKWLAFWTLLAKVGHIKKHEFCLSASFSKAWVLGSQIGFRLWQYIPQILSKLSISKKVIDLPSEETGYSFSRSAGAFQ